MVAVVRPEQDELATLLTAVGCEIVRCPEAEGGMGHSLAAGVRATDDAAGWIVALADMPFIASSSHLAIASSLRTGATLAATQYQGRLAHPVGFSRKLFAQLVATTGDKGGKAILEKHRQDLILCTVNDPGVLWDIDSKDDLRQRSGVVGIKKIRDESM